MNQGPLIAEIYRGSTVESRHRVDAVVVDASGRIIDSFGDTERAVFPRSAIKMIQALSLMESGAAEAFGLSQKCISLACASHLGELQHTETVEGWLERIRLPEAAFECGVHWPYDEETKFAMIRSGQLPSAKHNNCSGKHSGMLTTAVHLGENPQGYSKYDHPVQKRLRQILSEISQVRFDQASWGVDGCGIPTYAIPLKNMAVAMTALLPGPRAQANSVRAESARKILAAVRAEPEMISGTQGLCSRIVRVSGGRAIAKTGAEGVCAALIPEKGVAIALKVRDGAARAAELATIHLLKVYGGLLEEEVREFDQSNLTIIRNWAGLVVGKSSIRNVEFQEIKGKDPLYE
jgi:L-asparaginase II